MAAKTRSEIWGEIASLERARLEAILSARNEASAQTIDLGALEPDVRGRYREILEAAAVLFAERGYAATSIRDIGERVGLLGGSLYHHIKSKEALFIKIHDVALDAAAAKINAAVAEQTEPWTRMTAACVTLLKIQLAPDSITMPLMNDFRSAPDEVKSQLVVKRDEFEKIFERLVAALDLAPGVDRKVFRISLLTLLNNVNAWFRPGLLSAEEIAEQILIIFGRPPASGR